MLSNLAESSLAMATSYWAYFLNHFTHWQIAIPLTFVVHEVLYFAHYLPFFIGEKLPFLDKYKLQKVRPQALNRSFAYVARLFSALLLFDLGSPLRVTILCHSRDLQ